MVYFGFDGFSIIYGGEACGYVLEFSNGVKIYHAGDTAVFGDMAIIRELYAPKICMLPIGDHFTMSPREAAYACKLLQPEMVIPMHFGTFRLSYEPLHEPPRRLLEKALELQLLDKIRLLNEGEPTVF